jgi:hypothetical protein
VAAKEGGGTPGRTSKEDVRVDFRGRMCVLYPFSTQGAAISPSVSVDAVMQSFHNGLVGALTAQGMDVRMPVAAGLPAGALVISGQVVKADPGSQLMRWLFTFFAGGASFEVVGQVGDASGVYAQVRCVGTRRAGAFGGDSVKLMNDAAKLAGQQAAQQIAGVLTARP